jgi:TrpR-related protein YerC/YecD
MSKPKIEINEKEYFKEVHFLYEIINDLKKVEELKPFLKDILTSSELRMLKRRWHVAGLLLEGKDIRTVAMNSKTSTQTVSKIKKILDEGNGGLKYAIEQSRKKQKKDREEYIKRNRTKGGSTFVKGWLK